VADRRRHSEIDRRRFPRLGDQTLLNQRRYEERTVG
jgi:hypothetical protein